MHKIYRTVIKKKNQEWDDRESAQEFGKYAIGIYKKKDDDRDKLVGHAPAEISSLPYHFVQASDDN